MNNKSNRIFLIHHHYHHLNLNQRCPSRLKVYRCRAATDFIKKSATTTQLSRLFLEKNHEFHSWALSEVQLLLLINRICWIWKYLIGRSYISTEIRVFLQFYWETSAAAIDFIKICRCCNTPMDIFDLNLKIISLLFCPLIIKLHLILFLSLRARDHSQRWR